MPNAKIFLFALFLIGSSACQAFKNNAQEPTGQIMFTKANYGQTDIFVYGLEKERFENLTRSRANEYSPSLSSNAKAFAFTLINPDNFNNYEIYIKMDSSDTQTRLSPVDMFAFYPAWSWDGKTLSFQSGRGIYTLAADGTDLRALSEDGNSARAVWRPNSRSLTITKGQAITGFDIFLVDLTTGNQQPLVATEAQEFALDWSPDGLQLLYSSALPDTEEERIFVLDTRTGSSRPFFTDNGVTFPYQKADASWSPDGNWIAVEIEKRICIYDLNGILWDCIGEGEEPEWGP